MKSIEEQACSFGEGRVDRILLKMAPPVMLAQLIQALYNIVDSFFVGRFSDSGLTALSILYPVQLLMIALAVGTGVGINTAMSSRLGLDQKEKAKEYAGIGTPLAVLLWAIFAAVCFAFMPSFAAMSSEDPDVIADVIAYGRVVSVFSFGLFLESIWTKILQAQGDMKTPMTAQILGAVTNIILDPILIFGIVGDSMGITGAAIATVAGQMVAALVVMRKGFHRPPALSSFPRATDEVFRLGLPNILMQSAYTFYIFGLNMILSRFSDAAVTTLGLYYKWQTFFFIPLGAMQTCIVPIVSFNYAAEKIDRCRKTLRVALLFGFSLMFLGTICFNLIPKPMLRVFSFDEEVIGIGVTAFRIIGWSFLPLVTSLTYPVLFQAVGLPLKSSALTVIRTVVLFVPLGYLFSLIGLDYFWLTYPVTDTLTSLIGLIFSRSFFKNAFTQASLQAAKAEHPAAILPSRPGVIITVAREHGSGGKQIGKLLADRLGIPFYYKEMTALAAEEAGLAGKFISDLNRNAPSRLHDLYLSRRVIGHAIRAQAEVIRKIAENGSCVIVGRAADYVLRDNPNVFRIFVRAPKEYRIERVMSFYGDTRREAVRSIRRSDRARASYYRHISGLPWGDASQYDAVIDSSSGSESAAEEILALLARQAAAATPQP